MDKKENETRTLVQIVWNETEGRYTQRDTNAVVYPEFRGYPGSTMEYVANWHRESHTFYKTMADHIAKYAPQEANVVLINFQIFSEVQRPESRDWVRPVEVSWMYGIVKPGSEKAAQ